MFKALLVLAALNCDAATTPFPHYALCENYEPQVLVVALEEYGARKEYYYSMFTRAQCEETAKHIEKVHEDDANPNVTFVSAKCSDVETFKGTEDE